MTKQRQKEILTTLRKIWEEINDDNDTYLIWRVGSGLTKAINDIQHEELENE